MSNQIIRSSIHSAFAKTILAECLTRANRYFFTFGKTSTWDSTDTPPIPLDTSKYENEVRRNMVLAKEIQPNDVSLVVDRKNWVPGAVYDDFDYYDENNVAISGATSIEDSNFYVVTNEFNVYKCLYNNNGAPSTVKPVGQSTSDMVLSDGYIWKYMYSIHPYLQNKFLSSTQIPVLNAMNEHYYSDGRLEKFIIEDGGTGYVSNVTLAGSVYSGGTDYRILKTTNNLTGVLSVGNYFVVNNEVRIVGAITSTQITISSESLPLRVLQNSSIKKLNTYLELSGDGFNEENPYIVSDITVVGGGADYVSGEVSVEFSDPEIVTGYKPVVSVVVVSNSIAAINIIDPGYGYTKAPTIKIIGDTTGYNAVCKVNVKKSSAYLEPVIQNGGVINVIPLNKGIGFTYCNITVRRFTGTGTDASISANCDLGKINTQQSSVELSAVDGAIHVIKVINSGAGYSSADTVKVLGDGVGCRAKLVVENGSIVRVNILARGRGYSHATVTINTVGGSGAVLNPIISPNGGHGKSAVDELFARIVVFRTTLDTMKVGDYTLTNSYRQISLIKNLEKFGSTYFYQNYIGKFGASLTLNVSGNPPLATIQNNTILRAYKNKTDVDYINVLVIEKNANSMMVLPQEKMDDSFNGYYLKHPSSGTFYTITASTTPDVNPMSGVVYYIDNRQAFKPTENQQITVLTRLKV